MQTATLRAEFIWSQKQQRYIPLRKISSIIRTEFALLKGASAAENNLADSQSKFYQALQGDLSQTFSGQNAILSTLNNSVSPIVNAGPNQFGFSTGETNVLNSQAIQGTAQQYANASQALRAQQAAVGGGNTLLPSGVASQQQAALASAGANQGSNELLGIQQAGYQQGNANYNNAVSQLGGVAKTYDPTAYAGAANQAGSSAFSSASTIQQQNAAASPWNFFAPILGGVTQAGLSALTGIPTGGSSGGASALLNT